MDRYCPVVFFIAQRQGLNDVLEYLRKGDIIVVWRLDCLDRWNQLEENNIMYQMPQTIRELLKRNVVDFPDREAFVAKSYRTGEWVRHTWKDMDSISDRVAAGLAGRQRGCGRASGGGPAGEPTKCAAPCASWRPTASGPPL